MAETVLRKSLRTLSLTVNTAKYLRSAQIYGRVWFRLHRPTPDCRRAPPRRSAMLKWRGAPRTPSMIGPRRFRFLGLEREIREAEEWTRGNVPKLWLYNVHYFDDLLADGASTRKRWHERLIKQWIEENPPGREIGWDPYPTSRRIVNWIQWTLAGGSLSTQVLSSLATQARWLARRMEFHLMGNHLWVNAKALIFAGIFFDGAEAQRWLRKGLRVLDQELAEQILPDGGHFERSPMYHALVLEDILDLLQLAKVFPKVLEGRRVLAWASVASRMLRWIRIMSHPDGDLAFFNDSTMGIAPRYADLREYAHRVAVHTDCDPEEEFAPIQALEASGYVRLQRGPAVMIADVGEIGPEYQPGHAHADTLSFELSLHGRRVFVNAGVSTYEPGPQRLRQRGTESHNTVVIDGENSSEVWESFRVARRARPFGVRWSVQADELLLQGSHDGYRRLSRGLLHTRQWSLTDSCLRIEDYISGEFSKAQAMLLVHPDVEVDADRNGARLHWEVHRARVTARGASIGATRQSWHPKFGHALPGWRLEMQARANSFSTVISWGDATPRR
jgi:uncharacterized heparinase superfamily protein